MNSHTAELHQPTLSHRKKNITSLSMPQKRKRFGNHDDTTPVTPKSPTSTHKSVLLTTRPTPLDTTTTEEALAKLVSDSVSSLGKSSSSLRPLSTHQMEPLAADSVDELIHVEDELHASQKLTSNPLADPLLHRRGTSSTQRVHQYHQHLSVEALESDELSDTLSIATSTSSCSFARPTKRRRICNAERQLLDMLKEDTFPRAKMSSSSSDLLYCNFSSSNFW
mmetsp:Transcript_6934/g.25931  ORF Transcript_6934/g.25931 Transcript_6934/m.25931 type:complete len:223 (+) Transcript_6934:167-835(+)